MKTQPEISLVWVAALAAVALAGLGIDRPRPMVADLSVTKTELPDAN